MVGTCGTGDLGVAPGYGIGEEHDANALPDDSKPLCVGTECNGGTGEGGGKKWKADAKAKQANAKAKQANAKAKQAHAHAKAKANAKARQAR